MGSLLCCQSSGSTKIRRRSLGRFAKKGVFITTAKFSDHAKSYVSNLDTKVVLIDGKQLADFMIEYGVGVTIQSVYEIKTIDNDFFSEPED